ncbi:caspase family protein [Phenylobacterium sp.]|jgi:hypothetical protein|uniref:caspase family protein n=1 Tax=Phenylobacterium sp. TaxID=1871053 RepID=UPI002E3710D6|nr:caspase family protein [Phenylobacterium sp.]HEX3365519.1 caspase family protein [Phenylobacterium sp.]
MRTVSGLRGGVSVALALAMAGAGWTAPSSAWAQEKLLAAESYMVVDCLLPGQVRKLGASSSFLTPRRPVRTSAVNCEIRGGEYVAADRADFASSLAVWLPSAKQGDAKAQAYVGRIYADGLGQPPDYAQAAGWYQKAADQGYAQAMIDLGQLYERGLGVPQDPIKAVNLYRKASGLPPSQFANPASALTPDPAASAASAAMARDLDAARQALVQERAALAAARVDLARANAAPKTSAPKAEDVAILQRTLADKTSQLEASNARSAQLAAELAKAKTDADARIAPLTAQLQAIQADRAQTLAQRDQMQRDLAALRGQVPDQQRLAALEAQAGQARTAADQANAKLAAAQASLQARERDLATTKSRLADEQVQASAHAGDQDAAAKLRTAQADYDRVARELEQTRADAAARKTDIAQAQQALQAHEADLTQARAAAAAAETKLAKAQSDLNDRDARLKLSEAKLSQAEQQVAAARSDSAQRAAPLEQQLASLQTASKAAEAQLGQLRRDHDAAVQKNAELTSKVAGLEQQVAQAKQAGGDASKDLAAREAQLAAREAKVKELETRLASASRGAAAGPVATRSAPRPTRLPASSKFGLGANYAILIGESNYTIGKLQTLATPKNDVNQLGDLLQSRYGFSVKILLDKTRSEILRELDAASTKLGENDTLVIYYAGHGGMEKVRNGADRGYWLPVDAQPGSSAEEISNQEITYQVARMAARKVLIIADSCYSGLLTETVGRAQRPSDAEERTNDYLIGMAHKQSRNVLTSGGLEPVLDGGGAKEHSVFAAALIDILQANTDVMTSEELYSQIVTRVVSNATSVLLHDQDTPDPQTPKYSALDNGGHVYGDFLFVPKSSTQLSKLTDGPVVRTLGGR